MRPFCFGCFGWYFNGWRWNARSSCISTHDHRYKYTSDAFNWTSERRFDRYNEQPSKLSGWSCLRCYDWQLYDLGFWLNLESWSRYQSALSATKRSLITNAAAGSSVALALDSAEWFVATVDTVNIYDWLPQSEQKAIASLSLTANTITIATLSNSYQVARNAKVELVPQSPTYAVAARKLLHSFTQDSNSGQIWRLRLQLHSKTLKTENSAIQTNLKRDSEVWEVRLQLSRQSERRQVSNLQNISQTFQIVTDTLTKRKGLESLRFQTVKTLHQPKQQTRNSQSRLKFLIVDLQATKCQQEPTSFTLVVSKPSVSMIRQTDARFAS